MSGGVLAIRPRTLGDVVLVTPALRALGRGHPDVPLEVVTEARYAPLLEGLPGIARVWELERSRAATVLLIAALRRRRFDLVVDFFGNPRSALIAWACGARLSAGYALRGRGRSYAIRVPRSLAWSADGRVRREYAAATHLRLALAAGGIDDGIETRVTLPAAAVARAGDLLAVVGVREPASAVGLVAAGTWATKTWPIANAALLARRLRAAGREVVGIAGPGESDVLARLARLAPGTQALPSCGVADLAAVIARLGAVVGTDSGPIHLAASFGIPTFSWFGPTHPDTWSPPGARHGFWRSDLPCRGCDRTVCPHWNCLPALSAEHAAERVGEHLERHARSPSGLGPAAGA